MKRRASRNPRRDALKPRKSVFMPCNDLACFPSWPIHTTTLIETPPMNFFPNFDLARRLHLVLGAALAAITLPAGGADTGFSLDETEWERREVASGVVLFQRHFDDLFGAPQFVSLVHVDLDQPGVRVRFAASHPENPRKAPVPEFVADTGAVAATNGGYSGGGRGGPESTNSGIFKIDGEVRPFQRRETDEFHFVGGAALGIDAEGGWHFRNRPGDEWPEDWPEVRHALAGAHRLIEEEQIHPSILTPKTVREERHVKRRHPRTAVGLLRDRTAVLITVDGRHRDQAEGMTLEELATFMKDLGCIEALNLDGGGSTTLWVRDAGVSNHPSDNGRFDPKGARRVFSAVVVLAGDENEHE